MTSLPTAIIAALVLAGPRPHPSLRAASDSATRHHRRVASPRPHPVPKRAKPGDRVPVVITYYCLRGTTRTDKVTREGIIAADPRVFPLYRHVDVFGRRGRPMGRFLVADTGADIKGGRLDVWVPSCADARRRGKHRGLAVMLTRAESRAERATDRKRDAEARRQRVASGR